MLDRSRKAREIRETLREQIRRTVGLTMYVPQVTGKQMRMGDTLRGLVDSTAPAQPDALVDPADWKHWFMVGKDRVGDTQAKLR